VRRDVIRKVKQWQFHSSLPNTILVELVAICMGGLPQVSFGVVETMKMSSNGCILMLLMSMTSRNPYI